MTLDEICQDARHLPRGDKETYELNHPVRPRDHDELNQQLNGRIHRFTIIATFDRKSRSITLIRDNDRLN